MSDDLTDEQIMAIWDDESGTPPPMTAAEMDRRLAESTEKVRQRTERLEEHNRRLEALAVEGEALVAQWKAVCAEGADPSPARIEELRRRLREFNESADLVRAAR